MSVLLATTVFLSLFSGTVAVATVADRLMA